MRSCPFPPKMVKSSFAAKFRLPECRRWGIGGCMLGWRNQCQSSPEMMVVPLPFTWCKKIRPAAEENISNDCSWTCIGPDQPCEGLRLASGPCAFMVSMVGSFWVAVCHDFRPLWPPLISGFSGMMVMCVLTVGILWPIHASGDLQSTYTYVCICVCMYVSA